MIYIGIILLVSVATVMSVLSIRENDYYRKITASGMSLFLWLGAAAGSPQMSFPYTKIFENAADNTYTIVKGTHHASGAVSWLSWAWFGMAIIMGIYLFASTTTQASEEMKKNNKR